jgi:hypothetical protein
MKTPVASIDLEEASTVLATKLVNAAHITTFEPDGSIDPITTYHAPEGVHTKVKQFIEKELCELLKRAA